MQWCHTDLGANVYSWQRLLREDRRFGAPTHGAEGFDAEHFDGVMASSVLADGAHNHACVVQGDMTLPMRLLGPCCALRGITRGSAGWSAHHVAHACLFDHSPSPQRCARSGGIWDDSRCASLLAPALQPHFRLAASMLSLLHAGQSPPSWAVHASQQRMLSGAWKGAVVRFSWWQ